MTNRTTLIIIGIVVLLLIMGIIFFLGKKPSTPAPAALEFWGVGDDEEVWAGTLAAFQEKYPYISLTYRQFTGENYEENLINSLAEGRGPDIFMLKNSWALKHKDKVYPLPQNLLKVSVQDFKKTFVDVAAHDIITKDNRILGLPTYIDTLALFYNRDLLNAGGIAQVPDTWEKLADSSQKITRLTPAGDIQRSGIALGSTKNIEHAYETILALMLQNGDPITNAEEELVFGPKAGEAVRFYTSFADSSKKNYSWNSRLKNSLQEFAEGTVAMVYGFSSDILRVRAKNPHLSFSVASLPQPSVGSVPATYATYFFPAVSKFSQNPEAAWSFVIFAASRDGVSPYLEATSRAPARRDIISAGAPNEELTVFYRQALVAKSWLSPDEKATRLLFDNTLELILGKTAPEEALRQLREQLQLLLPENN